MPTDWRALPLMAIAPQRTSQAAAHACTPSSRSNSSDHEVLRSIYPQLTPFTNKGQTEDAAEIGEVGAGETNFHAIQFFVGMAGSCNLVELRF